jgi:carbon-monoxide dehydrogenase small subunit
MTEHVRSIALTVNGEEVREIVEARTSLVDFLRERLGLTGSHVGCEQGACGACTVRLDDVTVRGCLVLAVQCAGSRVETIEGVSDTGEIADLQEAFVRRNALQCGFCTPGMLLAAQEVLAQGRVPSREEIRAHLAGNYCRCTGYQAIVEAVEAVAMARCSITSLPSGQSRDSVFSTARTRGARPHPALSASGGGKEEGAL